MMDHGVHGCDHERLIKVVENIPVMDTFPARSHLFRIFNDPKEYQEARELQGCIIQFTFPDNELIVVSI
jgi:hypothetical protein